MISDLRFKFCRVLANISDNWDFFSNLFFWFLLIGDCWTVELFHELHYPNFCGERIFICCFENDIYHYCRGFFWYFMNVFTINVISPYVLDTVCQTNLLECTSVDFQYVKAISPSWNLFSLDSKIPLELFLSQSFLQVKSIQTL